MSTSFRGLGRRYEVQGSKTAESLGLKGKDLDVLHLCDAMVVNDLKDEYYYSQNDIALDAFEAHQKILNRDAQAYVSVIQIMRPVMLEAHKVIAALYLWTQNIDRMFAIDLLNDVRPTWKMAFFYALKKAPTYAHVNGGWNRTVRKLVNHMMFPQGQPSPSSFYFALKYADKLKPLVRKAHLQENDVTKWFFKKSETRKMMEYLDYWAIVDAVKTGNVTKIESAVKHARMKVPYTVALGVLGGWSTRPEIAKQLLGLMTPWETILSLKKIQNTGLKIADADVMKQITEKLNAARLQQMKIDPIELFQAYNNIEDITAKNMLYNLIQLQVRQIGEAMSSRLGSMKVAVVFDCSGSMEKVAEWSMMLAYAIGKNVKDAKMIPFSDYAYDLELGEDMLKQIAYLKAQTQDRYNRMPSRTNLAGSLWGDTALGKGLMKALEHTPDIIFYISDFEGNMPPWSTQVYKDYKDMHGKFPLVVSIKASASPWTAMGEYDAVKTGRWLGIPEEYMFTIRNLWDLPTILEYLYNLLPLLRQRGVLQASPVYIK